MVKTYFVYLLTNKYNTVLYTGITSSLVKRVWQHKNKLVKGFTYKYNLNKLAYYELYDNPNDAIKREKQIKGWLRKKKIKLIKTKNPNFEDLYKEIIK